ncbi:MAG TPA: thioredoxin domain-containing protein [Dokdonella sp.]
MPNRLANEPSPYLRQHAGNPVDWWPWGEEALAAARREHKPILLSIGYAACHWCHVMAHESFEDAATARVMNALYVNVKVDREERPDLDKVYQLAHQALTRRGGGWPLTVFLTPDDLLPFFAGTYFPPTPRAGLPSFLQVLEGVRGWFDRKPDEVRAQNAALASFLAAYGRDGAAAGALDRRPLELALARIDDGFDAANGGRRGAPKFPHASEIELLLGVRAQARPDAARCGEIARVTLARMAERGLRDHLGGGFFRYCVDAEWEIPHFEKMLYDNAALLPLYARAGVELGEPRFAAVAGDVAAWLGGEMSAPDGGFWSSLDADADGAEGAYYVWQRDEIRALLDADEFAVVEPYIGLDRPPNFEQHAWHLRESAPLDAVAARLAIAPDAARARWASARAKLRAARARRARPGLDDKRLAAWNALAIAGAARALRAQPDLPALREHAERALDFVHRHLWIDGRLYASHARGETKHAAYLDDHAFLLDALLAMLQLRWSRRDLDGALALADDLLERFEDRERGGFWFTAHDAEPLPQRPKPWFDESLPSGNGVAARALLALGHLLGEPRYLDAAERTLRAAAPTLAQHPEGACTLLLALDEFLRPRTRVVVRAQADELARWTAVVRADADVYPLPATARDLPDLLARSPSGAALLCRGTHCSAPLRSPDALAAALAAPEL